MLATLLFHAVLIIRQTDRDRYKDDNCQAWHEHREITFVREAIGHHEFFRAVMFNKLDLQEMYMFDQRKTGELYRTARLGSH